MLYFQLLKLISLNIVNGVIVGKLESFISWKLEDIIILYQCSSDIGTCHMTLLKGDQIILGGQSQNRDGSLVTC